MIWYSGAWKTLIRKRKIILHKRVVTVQNTVLHSHKEFLQSSQNPGICINMHDTGVNCYPNPVNRTETSVSSNIYDPLSYSPSEENPESELPSLPESSISLRASSMVDFADFLLAFTALELGFGLLLETS